MASNQTSNYQLHLWEPGDDFLREEFNENSERVDAALGELLAHIDAVNPVERLGGQTLTAAAARVDVDLSAVDWEKYREVQVWFRVVTSDYYGYKILLDGNAGSVYGSIGQYSRACLSTAQGNRGPQSGNLRFLPGLYLGCIPELSYVSSGASNSAALYWGGTPIHAVNFISDSGSAIFLADSEFRVYGVKK